jgi:AcrR family transcriptional regulator
MKRTVMATEIQVDDAESVVPARGTAGTVINSIARRAFAEHGYHGVSVRDIAVEANLSLSALYHYYSSKQDLLFAIIDEGSSEYRDACLAALANAGNSVVNRLEAFVTATVEYRANHSVESNLVINEMRSLTEDQQTIIVARRSEANELLREIIEAGLESGDFHTPIPDEGRRAIFACVNAIAQWYDPQRGVAVDTLSARYVLIAKAILGVQV